LFAFIVFTETKLFASGLLCCRLLTLVFMGTIQWATFVFMSCCVLLLGISWNKKNSFLSWSVHDLFTKLHLEAQEFFRPMPVRKKW